jgi:hypothetical protein
MKPIKVNFAPGAFDDFEGTQEELDDLIKQIQDMFSDPEKAKETLANAKPLDIDDLDDDELAALAKKILSDEEIAELKELGMPVDEERKLQ